MCETESGWGEWKELGWESKMGGRLGVWKDFSCCEKKKAWSWGRVMEFFLGFERIRAQGDRGVIAWKFWNGPELGDVEGILVRKCQLDPRLEMWTDIWLEIFSWIPAGASWRTLLGDCEKVSR